MTGTNHDRRPQAARRTALDARDGAADLAWYEARAKRIDARWEAMEIIEDGELQ